MIPTFSRICAICPENHESLVYTFMVALINIFDGFSKFFGAVILKQFDIKSGSYDNLWVANILNLAIAGFTMFSLVILANVPVTKVVLYKEAKDNEEEFKTFRNNILDRSYGMHRSVLHSRSMINNSRSMVHDDSDDEELSHLA